MSKSLARLRRVVRKSRRDGPRRCEVRSGRLAAEMVLKEWLVGRTEVKAVVGKLRGGWTSSARNRMSILVLGLVRARVGTFMQVNDESILAARVY